MGLFGSLFGSSESYEEIEGKIYNSECGDLFATHFCKYFNAGDVHFQWLISNSKERMFKMEFYKEGVVLKQIEVSRRRLKETGTYDVGSEMWGFGASGYADLPNSQYVSVFRKFLLEQIEENCPDITVDNNDYIKIKETAKKGW